MTLRPRTVGAAATMFLLAFLVRPHPEGVTEYPLERAYAAAADSYLRQTQSVMSQYDRGVATMARGLERKPSEGGCFQEEKKKFEAARNALARSLEQAKASSEATERMRPSIESGLEELKEAYARTAACYK